MRIPFTNLRLERRAYTDAVTTALVNAAAGATGASPSLTGALEAASGLIGRAFASAIVEAPDAQRMALSPELLGMVGRSLIRTGEVVFVIDTSTGLALLPCMAHTVRGGPNPATWRYDCEVAGPDGGLRYDGMPASGVVHVKFAVSPGCPWQGIGPLQAASLAGRLSAETAKHLADEASGARGNLIPIPVDGEDPSVDKLRQDLKDMGGRTALVQSGDWSSQDGARATWDVKRIGADPPAALVAQHAQAFDEVVVTCGVPAALFSKADGTAQRESWRRFLHSTVAPLGRIMAGELTAKLETEIKLDWQELRASDVTGKARALQSMVGAGVDVSEALALSGLMAAEE